MKSLKEILREGVELGHWTVEQLDPIPDGHCPGAPMPRNLLRSGPPVVEKVQVTDDRDLPVMPTGVTPAERHDLPITLDNCPF